MHVPTDGVTETIVTPLGIASLTTTFAAGDGPPLVTVKLYVTFVPAMAVGGPVLMIERSATERTVKFTVERLLFGFGSGVSLRVTATLLMS